MGIRNPTKGVYSNRAESINAKFNRMKQPGVEDMTDCIFTVYDMHRDHMREITRAYHRTGSNQLMQGNENLQRPIEQLPAFNDLSVEEYRTKMDELGSTHRPAELAPEEVHDPIDLQTTEMLRQAEWYDDHFEEKFEYSKATRSFLVSGYNKSLNEEAFMVKPDSCSCSSGAPCTHWVVAREKLYNAPVSRDALYKQLKAKNKEQEKGKRKRKIDYGKKGYVPMGENPAHPKLSLRRHASDASTSIAAKVPYITRPGTSRPPSTTTSAVPSRDTSVHEESQDALTSALSQLPVILEGDELIQLMDTTTNLPPDIATIAEELMDAGQLLEAQPETVDPPSVLADERADYSIDVDTVTPAELDNNLLGPQEGRFIAKNGETIAFVKADNDTKAIVLHKKSIDSATREKLEFIGTSLVKNGAYP